MTKKKASPTNSVDRRRFLTGLAGTAAGVTVAGHALATGANSAPRMDRPYDVIVLGGGFAGITAARDSVENGFNTLVLEARNRLGGRTFTSEFEGHQVELGGAWIHWVQPNVWAEKERYGIDVEETPGFAPDIMLANIDGTVRQLGEADVVAVMEAFQMYVADSRHLWERPYDVPMTRNRILKADKTSARDRLADLELTAFQREMLAGLIASCAHNTTDSVAGTELMRLHASTGFGDFFSFMDAMGRYTLKGGTKALLDAMLADAKPDVSLSSIVTKVEDLGDRVRVTTENGTRHEARALISTLPMNVIGDVEFSPALAPAIKAATQEKHTGSGTKVYAKTRKPVGNLLMFGREDAAISTAWTYKEAADHTLIVCFNNNAHKIDMYDESSVEAALKVYLPEIEVDSVFGYDWNLDLYARGTYASYRPGWAEKYMAAFQQDHGRILMASGDHGGAWRGFIDGAIREGSRAAHRARKLLGEKP